MRDQEGEIKGLKAVLNQKQTNIEELQNKIFDLEHRILSSNSENVNQTRSEEDL